VVKIHSNPGTAIGDFRCRSRQGMCARQYSHSGPGLLGADRRQEGRCKDAFATSGIKCTREIPGTKPGRYERSITSLRFRADLPDVAHYHSERNHKGLENRNPQPASVTALPHHPVQRRQGLGGMLSYYHRKQSLTNVDWFLDNSGYEKECSIYAMCKCSPCSCAVICRRYIVDACASIRASRARSAIQVARRTTDLQQFRSLISETCASCGRRKYSIKR
jgi:hypothetical protein